MVVGMKKRGAISRRVVLLLFIGVYYLFLQTSGRLFQKDVYFVGEQTYTKENILPSRLRSFFSPAASPKKEPTKKEYAGDTKPSNRSTHFFRDGLSMVKWGMGAFFLALGYFYYYRSGSSTKGLLGNELENTDSYQSNGNRRYLTNEKSHDTLPTSENGLMRYLGDFLKAYKQDREVTSPRSQTCSPEETESVPESNNQPLSSTEYDSESLTSGYDNVTQQSNQNGVNKMQSTFYQNILNTHRTNGDKQHGLTHGYTQGSTNNDYNLSSTPIQQNESQELNYNRGQSPVNQQAYAGLMHGFLNAHREDNNTFMRQDSNSSLSNNGTSDPSLLFLQEESNGSQTEEDLPKSSSLNVDPLVESKKDWEEHSTSKRSN